MSKNILYSHLPKSCLEDAPNEGNPDSYLERLLKRELPSSEKQNITSELHWQFLLDKPPKRRKPKPSKKKRTFLTRKERQELNILKLPKTEWKYDALEGIRQLWKKYMLQNLEISSGAPSCSDPDWNNFSSMLSKCELSGSEVTVVRSKVPSHVGITGTIVLETKMTFQLVTPKSQLKIIPKNTSVFEFVLENMKFTIFGKHIMTKPSERSVKKIKQQMLPDL